MKFIEKLNIRLIIVHVSATLFLLLAAKRISLLYNFNLIEAYYNYGTEFLDHINGNIGERIASFFYGTLFSHLAAFIISFIISFAISKRKNIYWMNSVFVLIISFILNYLGFLQLEFIKFSGNAVGNLFVSFGLKYVIVINCVVLLTLGLVVYFNKWSMRFIQK